MRRVVAAIALIAVLILLASIILLGGCGSSNQAGYAASDQSAFAGGTGAFGEDPVNPGEHSRERFMNAVQAGEHVNTPTTKPAK